MAKQQYFNSLTLKVLRTLKRFWKTVKPLFSKSKTANTVIFHGNNNNQR